MSKSIDQQIQELEAQKKALEEQKRIDLKDARLAKARELEGKVRLTVQRSTRRTYIHITHFIKVYWGSEYSSQPSEVRIKTEWVTVRYDLQYSTNCEFQKGDMIYTNNLHSDPSTEEITLDQFKLLRKAVKSSVKFLIAEVLAPLNDKIFPTLSTTYAESKELSGWELNKHLLDYPHVELTLNEVSLIGPSIFLNGTTYLVTKQSLRLADNAIEALIKAQPWAGGSPATTKSILALQNKFKNLNPY